jgi:hydrogenase-1 operon protein HyaF
MTRLNEIPIQVLNTEDGMTSNVIALLNEITTLQAAYLESGEVGQIDMKSLPLTEAELESLKTILADGEVSATVNALGKSQIQETQIPGVWWVRHYDINDVLMSENIEICRIPEILSVENDEIRQGEQALRDHLIEIGNTFNDTGEQEDNEQRRNIS